MKTKKNVFSPHWGGFCAQKLYYLSNYCNFMINNNTSVRSKFMHVRSHLNLCARAHAHSLEGTLPYSTTIQREATFDRSKFAPISQYTATVMIEVQKTLHKLNVANLVSYFPRLVGCVSDAVAMTTAIIEFSFLSFHSVSLSKVAGFALSTYLISRTPLTRLKATSFLLHQLNPHSPTQSSSPAFESSILCFLSIFLF